MISIAVLLNGYFHIFVNVDAYWSPKICDKYSQIWDPIYDRCYSIFCGFLYTNVGGYCEYRNITRKQLLKLNQYYKRERQGPQMETCTMISLHDWEIW